MMKCNAITFNNTGKHNQGSLQELLLGQLIFECNASTGLISTGAVEQTLLKVRIHFTTRCTTSCTTNCTTGSTKRFEYP